MKLLAILLTILSTLFPGNHLKKYNVENIPRNILDAFKEGDSEKLSEFLNDNVELVILEKEDVYSKVQAKLILKDFFTRYIPNNFVLLHEGGKEGVQYGIGNLSTNYEIFRVFFQLKLKNNQFYIHLLRIEREED